MINYLFLFLFNNIRIRIQSVLNIIKLDNNKFLPISTNKNLSDTNFTLSNGYNRNLSTIDYNYLSDIINLTILFNKYDLLEKLKSNNYNENQKIIKHNNISTINIFNGNLLDDWKFNITN